MIIWLLMNNSFPIVKMVVLEKMSVKILSLLEEMIASELCLLEKMVEMMTKVMKEE